MVSSDGIRTTFTTEDGFKNYVESVCVYCATDKQDKVMADLIRRTTIANKDDISCNIQYSPLKLEGVIENFNRKYQPFFEYQKKVDNAKAKLASYLEHSSLPGHHPRKKRKSRK
jgi:hypothetical protein